MSMIKQLGREVINSIAHIATAGASAAANVVITLASATATVVTTLASATATVAIASWNHILLPIGATGLNLTGYILEKALWGPPGLRKYAAGGLLPTNVNYGQRNKIISQFGFDPYENIHPFIDNIFGGFFGLGAGLIQYVNYATIAIENFVISVKCNLAVTFNLILGKHGVLGERLDFSDDRKSTFTKIVFGVLSAPLVAVIALATNALDIATTSLKHALISIDANNTRTFNLLLGNNGSFGERESFDDSERHVAIRWIFGLTTASIVIGIASLTNAFDISVQILNHSRLSIYFNVKATYNLLGTHGLMGERSGYTDDRESRLIKGAFGILSLPVVAPIILMTNALDGTCVFIKHTSLSISNNLRPNMNLLGQYGVFGDKVPFEDNRTSSAKVFYDIISLLIVLPLCTLSNLIDASSAFVLNTAKSVGHQVHNNYNILGKYGILGARKPNADQRATATQWVFGVSALPFTAPLNLISNLIDFTGSFFKQAGLSYYYNMKYSISLIKHHKQVPGADDEATFDDPRHPIVIGVFGTLTSPLVLASSILSYTHIDGLRFVKNSMLSIKHNFLFSYNLLGRDGVFGERRQYDDPRTSKTAKLFYGIITSPVVLIAAAVTNITDVTLSTAKQLSLSIGHNIRATYNALGVHGVLGEHKQYSDTRHLATRILFGIPSLLVVIPAVALTNSADGVMTFIKHTVLSFGHNLRATYHLLGTKGTMGEVANFTDERHMALKVVFGIISVPAVLIASATTNTLDATLSIIEQTALSFWHNLTPTFNLILGQHGVFGPRLPSIDERSLFAKIVFGILSLPFVFIAAKVTNGVDLLITGTKHLALSYAINFNNTFNLLGNHGVFGARHSEDDDRHQAVKIIFGLLSLPGVLISAALSNTADATLTTGKHTYNMLTSPKFWKITGGIIGGSVLTIIGLPLFMLRRTLKSAYYISIKGWFDPDKNHRKYVKSLVNIITLGTSALGFKYFGYSSRFRPKYMQTGDDEIKNGKQVMRDLIYQAKRGELELENDAHSAQAEGAPANEIETHNIDAACDARKLLRFVGIKHSGEKVLKHFDDRYREFLYEAESKNDQLAFSEDRTTPTFHTFFISQSGKLAARDAKLEYGGEMPSNKLIDDLQKLVDQRTQSVR